MLIKVEARIRQGLLCRFRAERKLTQKEAAKMADVSPAVWSAIECMKFAGASWGAIRKVAALLDVDTDLICPREIKNADLRLKYEAYREEAALKLYARDARARLMLPSPSMEADLEVTAIREAISEGLKLLTYREREILSLRYGLKDGIKRTYESIGKSVGASSTRVQQIVAKAIRKLQSQNALHVFEKAMGGRDSLEEVVGPIDSGTGFAQQFDLSD